MTESSGSDLDVTAILVKTMAMLCVRNTKLEDIHPGLVPVTSVWQKTPTPARNLRRTATHSARFGPRNPPHRHH